MECPPGRLQTWIRGESQTGLRLQTRSLLGATCVSAVFSEDTGTPCTGHFLLPQLRKEVCVAQTLKLSPGCFLCGAMSSEGVQSAPGCGVTDRGALRRPGSLSGCPESDTGHRFAGWQGLLWKCLRETARV